MGENSYKNMRASGMDDVIFSGSGNRPARNTAEVGLYLDNSDRTAPAAFNDADEIQVTRRIERENGSVYRINGKEARAKDVQLLFADASTGARSPSMVGQGRIGELINAKPQARRQLLEEAAGISGLHSRRHEAELRLRAAETNLERLEDMLSADIRAREATLLHIRWVEAKEAEGEAESALNQATNIVAEKAQGQMEAAKQQGIASLKLPELREDEARVAAALQRLQIARTQLDDEANRLLRRRDELARRLSQLGEDIVREERLVSDNAQILARLDEEEAELLEILSDSGRHAEEMREAFEAAAVKLAESEAVFTSITAERAEAAAGRQQLERTIRDLSDRKLRRERQSQEASAEIEAIDEKLSGLPDPSERREAVEAAEIAVEDALIVADEAEAAVAEARSAEALARGPLETAKNRLNALDTEARTITKILASSAAANGSFTPVAEEMTVERGFEAALGAALGDDLESPLDAAAPAYWAGNGDGAGDPALPQDVSEARRLLPSLKAGQRLVTREGALFRWDGHIASADAPGAAALRLSQKNQAEDQLAARTEDIRSSELRLSEVRDRSRLATRQLAEAREALTSAERASGDLLRRRDIEENARIEMEDAPDLSVLDLRLRESQLEVATDRGLLAEARARHEGSRAASAADHIATLREREEEAREEIAELDIAPEEFDEKRRNLLNELQRTEDARREAADRLAEAENLQRAADRVAATALSELAEAREKRGRAEERLVSAREKRQETEHRIRETLNTEPHMAFRLTGLGPDQPKPDIRDVERDLDRLKIERERLGAVNLRAEEEQAELSAKLAALIKERDDIIDAVRKLRAGIQNLNREGRERLIAAFDVVNSQFQRLFTHLFGGGTAELQLIESDDPLEAGLEILARPPGKKPQTMTLLSGGEQALTAMALIFAVFLTNPAPICVLDEVDAPLDDHNVERYCNLMDEMVASTETRFVVITHNPITMARMNRLFGVTMGEQGVSQLVSVDLQTAEQLREAV
ncbi:chromosome partition protein Smc [Ditylenchus destructor]|nr:chromosome partition protein Smc [Ditylenchus destructor]